MMTTEELVAALQAYIDDPKSGGVWIKYKDDDITKAYEAGLPDEMMQVRLDHGTVVLSP